MAVEIRDNSLEIISCLFIFVTYVYLIFCVLSYITIPESLTSLKVF